MDGSAETDRKATIACAVGLITTGGRVLLGLRSPTRKTYPGVWDLFGGRQEGDETIEATLVRELGEELDIRPETFAPVGAFDDPDPVRHGPRRYHVFRVTAWSGAGPRMCGDEHTRIDWFTTAQTRALTLAARSYQRLLERHVR